MMVKQDIIGPFILGESKTFSFYQNPSGDGYSDGYSIRYFSRNCGSKNGWISFGTVKKPYIETAKRTIFILFELIETEEEFIKQCKTNFRKNKSTVEIDVGGTRRVNSEWISAINSFIDGLFEKEQENMEEQMRLMEME